MSRTVVLAVALVACVAAAPAWAQPLGKPQVEVIRVRVPVGDLDLNSQAGADALIRRVSLAAARACGTPRVSGITATMDARAYRACKSKAVAGAMAQVDAPLVLARYAQMVSPGGV